MSNKQRVSWVCGHDFQVIINQIFVKFATWTLQQRSCSNNHLFRTHINKQGASDSHQMRLAVVKKGVVFAVSGRDRKVVYHRGALASPFFILYCI